MKVSTKIKWQKYYDFMDGTPRYTFGDRDPENTLQPISVVIYTRRKRKFPHDSRSVKNFYYGYVRHKPSETADEIGPFGTLKKAKEETLKLFEEYCCAFPEE